MTPGGMFPEEVPVCVTLWVPLVRYPLSVTSAISRGWVSAPVLSPSWSPGGISHSGGTKAGLDLKVWCWGNLSRSPGAFGWLPVT